MTTSRLGLRPFHLLGGACLLAVAPAATAQQADAASELQAQEAAKDRANGYVDLQGSLGYTTNASQGTDEDGSIFGRASILGFYSIDGDRSSTSLSAFAENSFYPNRNGSSNTQLARADVRHSYRASESVTVFGGVEASVDFGSLLSTRYLPAPDPTTGVPPVVVIDPALFGSRQRSYRLGGNLGTTLRVTERDNLTMSAAGQKVWYEDDISGLGFRNISAQASWDRILSERSTVGLRLIGQDTDYRAPGLGNNVYTALGTLSRDLAENWRIKLGVGASYSIRKALTGKDKSVSPAADVQVCKSTEFENFCGALSHDVQTTIGANATRATTASFFYSRRLSRNDSIDARAAASHYRGDDDYRVNYLSGGVAYSRRFSNRFSGGVDVSARDIYYRDGPNVPVELTGLIFLRYRIGDIKQ